MFFEFSLIHKLHSLCYNITINNKKGGFRMTRSVRYPAYPLVTHDPYFSIWSFSDHPAEDWTCHWTGHNNNLEGVIRIDGKNWRFMGPRKGADAMTLLSVEVLPTRTVYSFAEGGVRFRLTFLTPALPYRLDVMARPLTYICYDVESTDGAEHDVAVFFSVTGDCCVNSCTDRISWTRTLKKNMTCLSIGSAAQPVLAKCGDDLMIDWGHITLAVPDEFAAETCLKGNRVLFEEFLQTGHLPDEDECGFGKILRQGWNAAASVIRLRAVPGRTDSAWQMLAYNDCLSVEYLNRRLPGYWTVSCGDFASMLTAAYQEYAALRAECEAFDAELMTDAEQAGGLEYARLLAGAFRQAIAAHKLVADIDGTPLFFSKENFSNGCICTVDVTYPSSPLFLLMSPALMKGMLIPILEYAGTRKWRHPFAPHDLGTYPLANGQVYGGGETSGEEQMPVEECGNMLLLVSALAKFTNDLPFLRKYEGLLRKWAEYLAEKGYDPENQLCTDDFAGHLAHNTNLSIKAILALGGFSVITGMLGNAEEAQRYRKLAQEFAGRWVVDADDGEFYRLAFDRKGSWSQKYNLVWDRLLGLDLFPKSVAEKEMAHYRKVQNKYGLPLDSRKSYTKIDWILWSSILTGKDEDFRALLAPVWKWVEEGVTRGPMTDWYETTEDGHKVGFQARSVVGGLFIRLMADERLRAKWLAKAR